MQRVLGWTRLTPCLGSGELQSLGSHRNSCLCIFGTMILLQIVCAGFAMLHLVEAEGFQYTTFWNPFGNTKGDLVPTAEETPWVVSFEFDTEKILKGVRSTMLDVCATMVVRDEQNWTSSHVPLVRKPSFFLCVNRPSEVTNEDIRQG